MIKKANWYKKLFDQANKAVDDGFYLEATWISYSLIDDRIKSALKKLSINYKNKDMLGKCLEKLSSCVEPELLQAGFDSSLFLEIVKWKDTRNQFMHDLGNEESLRENFDAEIEMLAKEGIDLAKRVSATVMRLKKRLKKRK